ncbi:MAG: hypothetical protein RL033_5876 [Pseudomonadota bacterium]|jgi:hypothetical protein
MAEAKDEDIVVHYGGKYYILTKAQWQTTELEGSNAGPARVLIEAGGTVGYIPPTPVAPGIGGFSTVINLSAILKGSEWRE